MCSGHLKQIYLKCNTMFDKRDTKSIIQIRFQHKAVVKKMNTKYRNCTDHREFGACGEEA